MLTLGEIEAKEIRKNIVQKKPEMITLDDPFVQGIMAEQQTNAFFKKKWELGVTTQKRPAQQILRNDMWKGKRCFVIAGGPSLKGFDWSLLENELTIGINRVYEWLDCTILFAMDGRFYNWILEGKYGKHAKKRFVNFNGMKLWLDISNLPINHIFYLRSRGKNGLSWNIGDGLYHGNNSGYGALNLALVLGANPIYLLGYDMKFNKGKGHFHDGHPTAFKESMMKSFKNSFTQSVAQEIKVHGRKVINANRNSALKCFEFGDLPKDISVKKKPIYVSYYTDNGYQNEIKNLKDDICKFSLRNNFELIKDHGTWMKNCHQKPLYLKMMLQKYPKNPVVWVDADARIRQYPELFDNFKGDVGVHVRQKRKQGMYGEEVLSGTIYLANNHRVDQLLDLWIEENKNNPAEWDQRNLAKALIKWGNGFKKLPATYCQIFDSMKNEGGEPVIEHFQASRKYRRRK